MLRRNFNVALSLSQQQLVDCDRGNYGCSGGWPHVAYNYIFNKGITTEALYPYSSATFYNAAAQPCTYNTQKSYRVSNYFSYTQNDCMGAYNLLLKSMPAIHITAGNYDFIYYKSGILNSCGSPTAQIDHAVILAGYNPANYWLVKNSWSTQWGEAGYIRISTATGGNLCQVCFLATTPLPGVRPTNSE